MALDDKDYFLYYQKYTEAKNSKNKPRLQATMSGKIEHHD